VLTLAELVAASYGEAPIAPAGAPPLATIAELEPTPSSLETTPRPALRDAPIQQVPPAVEGIEPFSPSPMTYERAWDAYQRNKRATESANAAGTYRPFHDLDSNRRFYDPFNDWES
jgi:hypothetical protein